MTRPDERQVELLLSKEESLVPPETASLRGELAGIDTARVALAEIAGRDSVAAALAVARAGDVDAVVPTIVYTGTEYGDWSVLFNNVQTLGERLAGTGVRIVGGPQLLGSPRLWAALNGRYMRRLAETFGFCTPCVGCHLYVHLSRVPLAWALGVTKLISGERESHDGRLKINQTGAALDAYAEVMRGAGIDLAFPIRHVSGGAQVEELVGEGWPEGDKQLRCVLSKNYEDGNGSVRFEKAALDDFLGRYIVPTGRAVVEAWREGKTVSYDAVVAGAAGAWEPSP